MIKKWRLINSGPKNPYYNMALDESLFLNYSILQKPTLRIYSWRMPSFSVGFSQDADAVLDVDRCKREGIDFVRRISGGGILYHDSELTYSIVCAQSDLGEFLSVKESFKAICSFIIRFYQKLGLKPYFSCESGFPYSKERADFCLSSFQDYDITIAGKKIGGNAQKRSSNVIFQHGSIPIRLNFALIKKFIKQDLSCIEDKATYLDELIDLKLLLEDGISLLTDSFRESLSCEFEKAGPAVWELKHAFLLEKQKYRTIEWNIYRKRLKLSEREYNHARTNG